MIQFNKQVIISAALALICATFWITPEEANAQSTTDLTISVNPSDTSTWTIDENIFGKFIEHNGKDVYPGLYAQHLANPSFELWYHLDNELWQRRTAILYRETMEYDGLAYPWEPQIDDASSKQQMESGIHSQRFQRIQVSGGQSGGIRQRTALPDQRTQQYDVHLFIRGTVDSAEVRFETIQGEVIDSTSIAVSSSWVKDTLAFDLNETYTNRYDGSPFGEYALGIVIEGDGYVDLDGMRLMSGDAVRGKYNPTTINLLQEYNVTSIRWPGGNWASAYHWQDGVGPIKDRPVKRNLAWGGLESNFMGTSEFLEFCEIAGITPYLNIGFNPSIGPEEAGDWVEYVNGPTTTEMGSLRAEHGHPEPYDVKNWQVGNEVYGPYQIGHTTADDFAERFVNYYQAMKEADPDIRVLASGIDPLYQDYDVTWNQTVFDVAGDSIDGIDIHRYVQGVFSDSNREDWNEQEYHRNMVAFPTQYEQWVINTVRQSAANRGRSDMIINVGEWNLQPRVNSGWDRAGYPTMAHASFVAGMFNAFIRQGDAVRFSYQRDNTLFYRPFPVDLRPVNPGNYVSKYYAAPFTESDREYHQVSISNSSPTFFMEATGFRQQDTDNVPYVDASAIRSASGNKLYVFITNRSVQYEFDFEFKLHDNWEEANQSVSMVHLVSSDPFNRQTSWTNRNGFSIATSTQPLDSTNSMQYPLAPASVLRLELDINDATPIADDRSDLPRKVLLENNYPNPFNPQTTIRYAIPEATNVTLEVYNVAGKRIQTLVDTYKNAGTHQVTWNAGRQSSGVYYYKLKAGQVTRMRSMILVK